MLKPEMEQWKKAFERQVPFSSAVFKLYCFKFIHTATDMNMNAKNNKISEMSYNCP